MRRLANGRRPYARRHHCALCGILSREVEQRGSQLRWLCTDAEACLTRIQDRAMIRKSWEGVDR